MDGAGDRDTDGKDAAAKGTPAAGSLAGALGLGRSGTAARLPSFTTAAIGIAAAVWVVTELRSILQPLVLSVLIWFLLSAVARLVARLTRGPEAQPGAVALAASGALFATTMALLTMLLTDSIAAFRQNLPNYRENLTGMLTGAAEMLGVQRLPSASDLMDGLALNDMAIGALGALAGSLGQVIIIACIVFFIFAEAKRFPSKLALLIQGDDQRHRVLAVLAEMSAKIERYLGLKCLIGIIQAVPTWIILSAVGVDSPLVWSVFIFFLSFIPTIGSLVGIALPSLLALVQFQGPTPFIITLALLTPVQVLASNYLEPRLMGDSLNLSPLAIFMAIFGGGMLWGIIGALISVPALTVIAIALAQGHRTRQYAILLSRNGELLR
ncbi:MAG: AI-2E family transporter [Pseudomonadota bacterium]